MLRPLLGLCVTLLAIWYSDLESPASLQAFWLPLLAVLAGLFTLLCGQANTSDEECGLSASRRTGERRGGESDGS